MQGGEAQYKGLIPRIVEMIFQNNVKISCDTDVTIQMSMVEIYKEKIRDLLRVQKGVKIL
jgi:hypothetical protein